MRRSNGWDASARRIVQTTFCTFGIFNASRLSTSLQPHGGNYLLQFGFASLLFGVPLMWLYACIGAALKTGTVSMWRISPICKGIGVAALTIQSTIAIHSSVSIGWMLVYLKDAIFTRRTPFAVSADGMAVNISVHSYFRHLVLQDRNQMNLVSLQVEIRGRSRVGIVLYELCSFFIILDVVLFGDCLVCGFHAVL